MKTTKTYLSGCTWCKGIGVILKPTPGTTTSMTDVCPVCNGSKVITITEVTEIDTRESQEYEN